MPEMPGTPFASRYPSSDCTLEWWLGRGQCQRTMNARAQGRPDSASAGRTP